MICEERFKLIYYPVGSVSQLFDVKADPLEQLNLAGAKEHRETQQRLTDLLVQHLYGSDLEWVRDGELVGLPDRVFEPRLNRGLSGQRGWRFI